jgi:hypothetical protein
LNFKFKKILAATWPQPTFTRFTPQISRMSEIPNLLWSRPEKSGKPTLLVRAALCPRYARIAPPRARATYAVARGRRTSAPLSAAPFASAARRRQAPPSPRAPLPARST